MIQKQLKETRSLAGNLCLIGGTTLTILALTLVPDEWVNTCLAGAVLLGLISAGLSASAVSQRA